MTRCALSEEVSYLVNYLFA